MPAAALTPNRGSAPSLGRKREADGTEKLIGTPPPWLDWPSFVRKESGGKVTLETRSGQRTVVFVRR